MTAVAETGESARDDRSALALFASVSRLHIVAIGALGALTFAWVFFGERSFLAGGVAALDWFLVNLLNRVVDIPEDRANRIVGTDFVAKNRRSLVAFGFGLLASSLAIVHLIAPALTPFRVGFHALGLAYNWPLLPGRRRIKQLYFWKNTASACGFVLTVFAYPLAIGASAGMTPRLATAGIVLTCAFFVLFELSYEVLYDLRDAPGDRAAGVATYPVVHGERAAMRIVDGLVAASCACALVGFAIGAVPWRVVVMIAAPVVQIVYYKRVARRRGLDARDCIRLTWIGTAMLAAYNLWIWAGLPGV
ncbi:MAG: UbiA family prenyltransferase [Labilithrix sp.]|nr:UbiA family prenyltransferase [Labilithrix sp.]